MRIARFTAPLALLLAAGLACGPAVAADKAERAHDKAGIGKRPSEKRCEARDEHGDRRKHPLRIEFIGVDTSGRQHKGHGFRAKELRELRILIDWPNFGEPRTQRLELYNPNGAVYQESSADITESPMEVRIPVAGTWITQYELFGPWCVEVYLEGVPEPVARRGFVLSAPSD